MASVACRQLSASSPRRLTVPEFAKLAALQSDLATLCAEGVLEAFEDEHGVTRYRPTAQADSRAA